MSLLDRGLRDGSRRWSRGRGQIRRQARLLALSGLDGDVGLGQFTLDFILGLVEFLDGLAHSTSQFRQLLRAEQEQDDQQDYDQIRSRKVEEGGDNVHFNRVNTTNQASLQRKAWFRRLLKYRGMSHPYILTGS